MEMCLAWGVLPHAMEREVPRDVRGELWVHWRWRNERTRLIREREEAEIRAKARQGQR